MPYDPNMDECVVSKSLETEMGRIVISIYSYNQGQKKMQLSRENKDKQGNLRFAKLGRMTKEEIEGVLPLINEIKGQM